MSMKTVFSSSACRFDRERQSDDYCGPPWGLIESTVQITATMGSVAYGS
jgi:hypothetical protein